MTRSIRRRRHLIAAASAATLATLGTSRTDAGLQWDVRVIGATGAAVYNPKQVEFFAPGDTITMGLYAHVSGTNGINDESFMSGWGLMNSVGALRGNLSGGYTPAFFTAGSSQNGSVVDWDSDGDLDIGLSPTSSSSVGKFTGRSPAPTAMPSLGGGVQVGAFVFTYTGGGPDVSINFMPRNNAGNNLNLAAVWFEDAGTVAKNPQTSPLTVGLPVTNVPEPASLSVVALASVGLFKRRKSSQS